MRGLVDFYRSNPAILVVAIIAGAVVSVLAVSGGDSGGPVAEIASVAVVGIAIGVFIAWRRSRGAEDEL